MQPAANSHSLGLGIYKASREGSGLRQRFRSNARRSDGDYTVSSRHRFGFDFGFQLNRDVCRDRLPISARAIFSGYKRARQSGLL